MDLSLAVDASWATIAAYASGGPESPLVALSLASALSAALGYSARTGVKAEILGSLGFVTRVWYAEHGRPWSAGSLGRLGLLWSAGGRRRRRRGGRARAARPRAPALRAARRGRPPAHGVRRGRNGGVAEQAARGLVPRWQVSLRDGPGDAALRFARDGRDGPVLVPVPSDGGPVGTIECRRRSRAGTPVISSASARWRP